VTRGDRTIGFEDAGDHLRARDLLVAANYSEEGLRGALDRSDLLGSREIDVPPGVRRTRTGTPLDTLIRLFFLGVPVTLDAARSALHPMRAEMWAEANLLTIDGERVVPSVKIQPHKGLLLTSDIPAHIRKGAPGDFVLGVGNSSVLLAHIAIPRPVRRALDLGTGCGLLALLASARSERVVATDKNARAVAFAAFNARLNGIGNVECRAGDLFEPVAGQRFDLMMSNPPYVIAPTMQYLFRDSGVRGDAFCRELVRAAPPLLEEGGYCQLICNWTLTAGQSWSDLLRGWFEGTGCDALVWVTDTQDASSYATTWIQQTERDYLERFPELYDAWMRYYDREGIEAVSYGLIAMRRASGRPNWVRFIRARSGSSAPGGDHVLRRFQLEDYLEARPGDHQLLEERVRLAPDIRLEQHYAPKEGGFSAVSTRLHLTREPSYYTIELDPTITTMVMCCHGERSLRDVVQDMSATMRIDVDQLVPGALAAARRLIENGCLLPNSIGDS